MQISKFIEEKRDGVSHPPGSIQTFVTGVTRGEIPDYQISAWLMAVYLKGLAPRELSELTVAMVHSGRTFARTPGDGFWVDKHSTGGVGDKTSLILVPLVSQTAERLWGKGYLSIPMVSGRGLGHTGGTLDKLESVEGFRSDLKESERRGLLDSHGFFMMGQTDDFVPADRKLYALRDVTATIESLPLIVSSIMSKKLAEGIDALVIDLKCGAGAFMKTRSEATALATALIGAAQAHQVKVHAWITAMDEPIGRAVGNAIEVDECREFFQNPELSHPGLAEVSLKLGSSMLVMASQGKLSQADAEGELTKTWQDRSAISAFRKMLLAQGGKWEAFDLRLKQMKSRLALEFRSERMGYMSGIDCRRVGELLVWLGGGRTKTSDRVNPFVGFEFHRKVGDKVCEGELIASVFIASELQESRVREELQRAIVISEGCVSPGQWVYQCLV